MKDISLKNNLLYIKPNENEVPEVIINKIFNIVKNSNVTEININLYDFSMFNAIRVATILSAKSLTYDNLLTYNFIVNNNAIVKYIKPLTLSNCKVTVNSENNLLKENII